MIPEYKQIEGNFFTGFMLTVMCCQDPAIRIAQVMNTRCAWSPPNTCLIHFTSMAK